MTTQFVLDDSGNILKQTSGSNTLLFLYDDNGGRVGLQYNGANYLYVYNAQGDVIAIVDSNHNVVVKYTYDEWGNKVSVTGSMAATLGVQNPFRYRGYCYDEETGFYSLQSRYYDPETGRFLNADSQLNPGTGLIGYNMFAYCNNNPVNMADPDGQFGTDLLTAINRGIRFLYEVIETKSQLSEIGFKNVTTNSTIEYLFTIKKNSINTAEEKAHFLAQCAYETSFGRYLTELGGEAYFAKKEYGYKYRGAGYIQITWGDNYRAFATAMGDEEIYNQGANYVAENYAWQAAGWWWTHNNMNARIAKGASVYNLTQVVRGYDKDTWRTRQSYYDMIIGIIG